MNESAGVDSPLAHIVLVEPEIPNNTGNIGRTCVAMNCHLNLVHPLGFEITEKQVRRSGLDYWPHLTYKEFADWGQWESQNTAPNRTFFFTTKADKTIYETQFQKGDRLVFGAESRGLPETLLQAHWPQAVTLPMLGPTRSLNLANAVSIGLFELYRQTHHV